MDLRSKVAIVTGASSGLGEAFSKALSNENASLVFGIARNSEALNKLQKDIGDRFIPVTLDITNQPDVKSWVSKTFSEWLKPDILINNAGEVSF